METIEIAFAVAYKKDYSWRGQIIKAKLDPETGQVKFWQIKLVVDKNMVYHEEEIEKLKDEKKQGEKECLEFDEKSPF